MMMSGVVRTSAAQLMRIIEDTITLSEIDSETLAVVPVAGNIQEMLAQVVAEASHTAVSLGKDRIEILVDNCVPDDMQTVSIDMRKVSRVLMHLVDNAVKQTDQGYILLRCEAMCDARKLFFSVEDTGSGIEEADLDKVFVRFWKKRDPKREFRGLGIGLPVCMELLRLMGSEIKVESKAGEGTEVCFEVPVSDFQ
jgi:signal transduction histidine kinase